MEGFTVAMALTDALPVLLFSGSMALVSLRLNSPLFAVGAGLCILAGLCKVVWKLLLGLKKGDIKLLNRLFVPCMAAGFLLMVAAVVLNWRRIPWSGLWRSVSAWPQAAFFAAALLLMIFMGVLSRRFDRRDAKKNWRAQLVNTLAQAAIFLGILLIK